MSEPENMGCAVTFKPAETESSMPAGLEDYLFSLPGVTGFRFTGQPEEKRILVMVTNPKAAEKLPRHYHRFTLEPQVTGQIRAY